MGWSYGYDLRRKRDIGYGVPAYCDHPGCAAEIDRGLTHVCGGQPYGGEFGCGLFFCSAHLHFAGARREHAQVCIRCRHGRASFEPNDAEHPEWIAWKLTDESWQEWRDKNPEWVQEHSGKGCPGHEESPCPNT
jgi:hypothetical protein